MKKLDLHPKKYQHLEGDILESCKINHIKYDKRVCYIETVPCSLVCGNMTVTVGYVSKSNHHDYTFMPVVPTFSRDGRQTGTLHSGDWESNMRVVIDKLELLNDIEEKL